MTRDLDALAARSFDLLVVGGGIYGLAIAYDGAQRGLAVALIERRDFGGGASFNHLRTLHGGLRYLQTLDIPRARESVRERRAWATIAPHTVRPVPFALPLRRSISKGATAMRAGFLLDRLVAFDRNRGLSSALHLPPGRVLSASDALRQFPDLNADGLTAAAVWYDYLATEADRLTVSFALGAAQHGAALANYVEATALVHRDGRVTGVQARDIVSGDDTIRIGARLVVNATGANVDSLLDPLGAPTKIPMLKVMNLVTRRPARDAAISGRSESGRNLFLVPWRGRALFGTWESAHLCSPGDTRVLRSDVEAFIADINGAFPTQRLTAEDVTLVHRGIVAAATANGHLALEGHDQVRDHAADRLNGLISVVGAKYTTARGVAERVVDRAMAMLGRAHAPCRTATTPLPGGDIRDPRPTAATRRHTQATLASDTIEHLVAAYGTRADDVLMLCDEQPDLSARLSPDSPVIAAQLVWAARHEMAMTLADAVIRRTPLGVLGDPGDRSIERAALVLGEELGWTEQRQRDETDAVKRFYRWADEVGTHSTA